MVNSCCAFGCKNRYKKSGIGFFKFPKEPARRKLWTLAVRRKNFEPSGSSVVCGEHFQTGRPSKDPEHPDHIPNIFAFKPSKKTYQSKSGRKLCEVQTENIANKTCISEVISSETLSTSPSLKIGELSEEENETPKQENEIKLNYTEISDLMHQKDGIQHMELKFEEDSQVEKEMSVQEEELQQDYTEVCDLMHQEHVKIKSEEHSQVEKEMSVQEEELQRDYTEVCDLMHQEHMKIKSEDVFQKEELSSLKLELQQVYSTLHTITQDRDQLKEELSSANRTQDVLQNSLSDKEEELSKLKKELQQAYFELNALRREKEELKKKLSAADITQSILQDPRKLHFYTGLSSLKDFRLILSLLSGVENNVRRVSLETQTLIVLMKLKLNLCYSDLAHRFQCSQSSVQRIFITLIPILEAKLDRLVKSPITAALKKNIPVGIKNTVYENLYHRVQKNYKMRTKQEDSSDM